MSSSLDFRGVCMVGPRAIEETFGFLTLHLPVGWTGIVGPHRSGRSTLLRLAAGEVRPARGQVRIPGAAVYCGRDLSRPPARLGELLQTPDRAAAQLVGRLELEEGLAEGWGEAGLDLRRRAQVACALWAEPMVLALDEPTAGLEVTTRELLIALLLRFRGIGLVCSSDRALLDGLCSGCLLLGHGTPVWRKGNYAEAKAFYAREQEILRRQKLNAERDLAALSATVDERRHEAEQANLRRSKRYLDPHDHDARQKLDRARKSGKDSRAGQLLKQLNGRLSQAQERVRSIAVEEAPALPAHLTGEPAGAEVVVHLARASAEAQVEVRVSRADRIGVAAASPMVAAELFGEVLSHARREGVRAVHVASEVKELADQLELTWPKLGAQQQSDARQMAAFLGYAVPETIIVAELHGDELWKLVFAAGMAQGPNLILLAYPEHLLDLPSLERLEETLGRCTCALVIASGDRALLQNTTGRRWEVSGGGETLRVRVVEEG